MEMALLHEEIEDVHLNDKVHRKHKTGKNSTE
jgi:hypothetical protein